jgi:FkbM family methyltransferase
VSRQYAAFLERVVEALNGLQRETQRPRSRAELALALERRNALAIATPRGVLRFHGGRGRNAFLMAKGLLTEEPETIAWIETFVPAGAVLWDVGAAIGAYSLYAARGGARVIAFEPKATSYGLLTEHLALNEAGEAVAALALALSDRTGFARLALGEIAAGAAGNALDGSTTQFGHTPQGFSQGAISVRMDDAVRLFGLPTPDHVKLDVDGLEPAILAGGPETLAHVRSVLVEVEGSNADAAATLVERPLAAAGLVEDRAWRTKGSARNRLFVRPG